MRRTDDVGVVREEKKLKKARRGAQLRLYGGTEECVEQMTADSKSKPRSA